MKRSGEPAVPVLPWDEPFAGIGLYGIRHAGTNAGTFFLAIVAGESRGPGPTSEQHDADSLVGLAQV